MPASGGLKNSQSQFAPKTRIEKRALKTPAHTNRDFPAPLLNLGVKRNASARLAHGARNIKVGRGASAREKAINVQE